MKKAIKLGSIMLTAAMALSLSACATSIQTTDFYVDPAETLANKEDADSSVNVAMITAETTDVTVAKITESTEAEDDHDGSYHYMKQTMTFSNGREEYEESYYDDNGIMIRFRRSSSVSAEVSTTEYEYDAQGRLLKETVTIENNGEVTLVHVNENFYENDLLVKTDQTSTMIPSLEPYNEGCRVIYYEYDDKGLLIKEDTYYKSGAFLQERVYIYDDKGNLLAEVDNDVDGNMVGSIEYEYDSQGNVISQNWLASDGVSYRYVNYEYNSNGDMIKESGNLYTYEFEYEYFNGQLICKKWFNADGNCSITEYAYDEYGRIIIVETYSATNDAADLKITYEYEW